jgi:hypothetical protein
MNTLNLNLGRAKLEFFWINQAILQKKDSGKEFEYRNQKLAGKERNTEAGEGNKKKLQ